MSFESYDELPLKSQFWDIGSLPEGEIVVRVLRARFPETFDILDSCLDKADPFDIVYPGNPHEYSDVILEMLVLLAPENADLAQVGRIRLAEVVKEALSRRFGEEPNESRTAHAVDLIFERALGLPESQRATPGSDHHDDVDSKEPAPSTDQRRSYVSMEDTLVAISCGKSDLVSSALLAAALESPDRAWVEACALSLTLAADSSIQSAALMALGHLAQRFGGLDEAVFDRIYARLEGKLPDRMEELREMIRPHVDWTP